MAVRGKTMKNNTVYVAFFFVPLLMMAFLCLVSGKNLFLSVPTWSDELDYFREIYSFSKEGLNFGGSLFEGYEASFGPLGGHSFSPIIVWGLFSLIFPFSEHSILIINLLLLGLSFMISGFILKPKGVDIIYTICAMIFFVPLLMYIFSSMIEIPLYAGLILYFSLLKKYINEKDEKTFICLILVGIWCMFVRMPYVVILFPAIWAKTDFSFSLKTFKNMVIYVVSFLLLYKIYNLFCADYPDWVTSKIAASSGVIGKLKTVLYNSIANIKLFFGFSRASWSEIALRYVYGFLIVFFGVTSFLTISEGRLKKIFDRVRFSAFVMSGGLFAIMITLYDIKDYRDFRTFGPIVLLMFLLSFARDCGIRREKTERIIPIVLYLILLVVANPGELANDRITVRNVEKIDALMLLDEERENGEPTVLAATMDINWADASVMKSLHPKIGYKVFYNNQVNDLANVDYIFTTHEFMNNNPECFTGLKTIEDVEGYGVLLKVR